MGIFTLILASFAVGQTPEPGAGSVIWQHDFSNGMPAEFEHNTDYPDSGTWGRAHDLDGGGTYEPASISGSELKVNGPSCTYRGTAYPTTVSKTLQEWELYYRVDARPGSTGHGDRSTGGLKAIGGEPQGSYNADLSIGGLYPRAAFINYGSDFQLGGYNSSGDFDYNSKSAAIDIASGEWHVRVASSQDNVKTWVKYWKAGNSEPSGWNLEFNRYLSGRPGFGAVGTCKGSSRSNYYDFYELRNIGLSTNDAPNAPSNPNPSDTQDTVGLSPNLEVDVSDPDGDSMNVTFYDASDNSVIGTDTSVASGGTATVQASSFDQTGTTYNWYTVADDGSATTRGPSTGSWNFTTEHEPEIDQASATPQGGQTASTSPDLSVDVYHPDGRTMDVTFFLNGTAFGSDQQVDGSGTATIQTDSLEANTVYEWSVVVDDRNGYTVDNQASPWSFETDAGNANISIDYGNNTNFGSGTAVLDVVPGHSHADTVDYVRLLDGTGTQIDEVQNVDVDSPVSLLWEGLNQDREYDWRAEVEHDGEIVQTDLASFTTLTVGINLTSSVQDAETYNVYRRTGSSGDTVSFNYGNADYNLIGSGNTVNLVDGSLGLETGKSYCYIVTAENLGGEGPGSSEMCTTSDLVLNP